MSFLSQSNLIKDADFVARVTHAAIKSAVAVQAEAANTVGHTKRTDFALQVLHSSQVYGPLMAQGVVTNVAITAASTDNDIEFTVNSLWNAFAGVIL